MRRLLLGSTMSALSLGLAAAFVGPSLLDSPRGEPLRVLAAEPAPSPLQLTSFQGEACASPAFSDGSQVSPGLRIVAVDVGAAEGRHAIGLHELAAGGAAPDAAFILVLDGSGRLLAIGDADTLTTDASREALAIQCGDTEPSAI